MGDYLSFLLCLVDPGLLPGLLVALEVTHCSVGEATVHLSHPQPQSSPASFCCLTILSLSQELQSFIHHKLTCESLVSLPVLGECVRLSARGLAGGSVVASGAIQQTPPPLCWLLLHSWSHKVYGLAVMTSLVLPLGAQGVHHLPSFTTRQKS